MNRLSNSDRSRVIACLCEGNSIRATERITGITKKAITRLSVELGEACERFADKVMVNLPCTEIQCDEIWAFCYAKEKNVPINMRGKAGDVWTWVAIDPHTKLIPCWYVGDRTTMNCYHRLAVAVHFVHYNFARVHASLRITPAMAAGLTDHVWELSEIVALLEAEEMAVTA